MLSGPSDPIVVDASSYVPPQRSLAALREALPGCRACHLWQSATQPVFGEGPARSAAVLVGEQPGDLEDRLGRPFVGPAGRLLDELLAEIGADRRQLYLTNAVKHFSHEIRGKWRIHKTPSAAEVSSCRPWLLAELERIAPAVLVCLGSVASRTLLGGGVRVLRDRGHALESPWAGRTYVTYHPSALLRMRGRAERARAREILREDLRLALAGLAGMP